VGEIRKAMTYPHGEARREAKKALRRLGEAVEEPPSPVHLVKGRRRPKGLEEWSANLDLEELEPLLVKLTKCVTKGFGMREVAEVMGVVEMMEEPQTRTFCFPVTAGGKREELWVVVFMDDVESPDVEVYGGAGVIGKVGSGGR
jgi:hypothetical protein